MENWFPPLSLFWDLLPKMGLGSISQGPICLNSPEFFPEKGLLGPFFKGRGFSPWRFFSFGENLPRFLAPLFLPPMCFRGLLPALSPLSIALRGAAIIHTQALARGGPFYPSPRERCPPTPVEPPKGARAPRLP